MLERFSPEDAHKGLTNHARQQLTDLITIANMLSPHTVAKQITPDAMTLLRRIDELDTQDITTDPQTIAWLNTAASIVVEHEKTLNDCQLWSDHLFSINLLLAGLAVCSMQDFAFCIPLKRDSIFRIPGAGISLAATHCAKVLDVTISKGDVASRNGSALGAVRVANYELAFKGGAIAIPDIPGYVQIDRDQFDAIWISIIARAHDLISINSKWSDFVRRFARIIGPLHDGPPNRHLSISVRRLPNAIFLSFDEDPMVVAEAIVHEADHNLVYALTLLSDFWRDASASTAAVYWSPWREDPRPLDGILRGASAFTTVSEWLLDARSSAVLVEDTRRRADLRAIETAQQVLSALDQIKHFGGQLLTQEGTVFVAQLSDRIERVLRVLRLSSAEYSSYADTINREIRTHKERYSQYALGAK